MTLALNIILLSLAGLSFLAAIIYIAKGFGARSSAGRQAYNVGQTEARRQIRVNWLRAFFLFLFGLFFLGLFAVQPLFMPEPDVAELPLGTTEPATATTLESTRTQPPPTPTPTPGPTEPLSSPTPEPTAEPTATPAPQTAVVSSGVGVWLRGAPSTAGQQLEWLLDGTTVTLLPERQTADELIWQRVQTQDGQVGWVAADFLLVGEPTAAPPPEPSPTPET